MRVLWFAVTPSLYDETEFGGWIASLERIVRKYCNDIQLGIAFEYSASGDRLVRDNVTYYPFKTLTTKLDSLKAKFINDYAWKLLYPKMLEIIDNFKPDIIQCFGSEWQYGAIAQYVNTPVIIHMQGFLNVYNMSAEMACSKINQVFMRRLSPKYIVSSIINGKKDEYTLAFERSTMKNCNYFMGRTDWDKDLVKYYSPNSTYYNCAEAIRPEIYNANIIWEYCKQEKFRIVTISQAGFLKGNEIILRTAKLLKDEFGFQFEWRVAGNADTMKLFERKTHIRHEDVNVTLLGMIDAKSVAKELASANVYVHPAIIDNSPNSLCEAQLIGCPVVAANTGGIPQLVDNGNTGVLYPYNEPHKLAFILMDLSQNQDKLEVISQNARMVALERHNPKAIAMCLREIYSDILTNQGV